MSYLIVSYYTNNTLYEQEAQKFILSLKKFAIPYYVEGVENLGSWQKNTSYKPTFIKKMLLKFPESSIVWVDCDAQFFAYPTLFDNLSCDVAIYVYDGKEYKHKNWIPELLSGTVYFRNCPKVLDFVEQWEKLCREHFGVWDQKHLASVLKNDFELLPGEYCKIVDKMQYIKNPVIVHYQASRIVRRHHGDLRQLA
jgi:hypothetical protein